MHRRGKITVSAAIYTMIKKWKTTLIILIIGLILGAGFIVVTNKKAVGSNGAGATSVISFDNKQKEDIERYLSYLKESAYMNLDPNNLHIHYIYYDIVWREQGLSYEVTESKNATLLRTMSLYYPSDGFAKEIVSYNEDYLNKALYEVVGISRSGNTYYFTIIYTDDSYVKDLCEIIDASLKKKSEEWYSLAGEFDFTRGPETDMQIDGFTSGYKDVQDSKRNTLTRIQAAYANNVSGSTALSKDVKETSMPVKALTVVLIAFLWTFVAGFSVSLFDKRFNSAKDVANLIGQDVVCIFKGAPESGLDKLFYKNNDRYNNPELFLSILNRRMTGEGIKRLFLYNCSDSNLSVFNNKIAEQMKDIELKNVENKEREFFLDVKEDEAVIVLVKGDVTEKESLYKMIELMNELKVKCAGVVFAV